MFFMRRECKPNAEVQQMRLYERPGHDSVEPMMGVRVTTTAGDINIY